MSGTPFVQRAIDVQFVRAKGTFASTGKNTVTLSGLRVSATIQKGGSTAMNTADIRIYGMMLPMMNDLSTLGKMLALEDQNTISIFAGEAGSALSLAYIGTINQAWFDGKEQPNVAFQIIAQTGMAQQLQPISPSSYVGSVDVPTILATLATQMGLTFENAGVSGVRLSNPYYPGTARVQAKRIAEHAGINISFDDGKLAIWPAGGHRGGQVPLISPQTGLISYPTFSKNGVDFRMLYNPAIIYGAQIKLQSSLPAACGIWNVYSLTHHLDAMTPGGSWFSDLKTATPGLVAPVS